MIIFGIDPGLTATGFGAIKLDGNRIAPLTWGVIRSKGEGLPERLAHLYNELRHRLDEQKPDLVAVEDIFIGKSPSSALKMGHARGVALLAAAHGGYPVREFPTAVIKQSVVGGGRAAKQQVGFMVKKLLALGSESLPEDAADALAAALCGVFRLETNQISARVSKS